MVILTMLTTKLQCQKLLGLAGGNTKKAWKQEIRREPNPLQRHSQCHVYIYLIIAVHFVQAISYISIIRIECMHSWYNV